MKKNIMMVALLVMLFASCQDSATTDETKKDSATVTSDTTRALSSADASFLSEQVGGNYAEIKLAQLAQQKSGNAEIKNVASMLEKDHNAVLNDLRSFASTHNVSVPAEEDSDAKDKYNDLDKLTGSEFDKKWCDQLIDKHEKGISKYEDAAKNLENGELRTWVNNTLPKLKTHKQHLDECKAKLK